MTAPSEKDVVEAGQQLLQRSEDELDPLTLARLRAARLRVLDAKPRSLLPWRLTGGVVAAGLALGVAGVVWFQTPTNLPGPHGSEASVADLDLLASENPDFYIDLEFYRWLARQSDAS